MVKIEKAKTIHTVKISQRDPNSLCTGANTLVFLDGKPLVGATSVKFEVAARGVGKVTIELLASVEIDETIVKDVDFKDISKFKEAK